MPFVIHGAWMPLAQTDPEGPRVRFSEELEPRHLDGLSRRLRNAALEVAEELDGRA